MRRTTRLGALAIGLAAWSALQARLLVRSTHMLQLEGYETLRFLRWASRNPLAWLRFQQAKKPFVPTARAKRLIGGQAALLLLGVVIARAPRTVLVGAVAAALGAPVLTAVANVLLWPVEESFRRYYLRDARRKLASHKPLVVGVAGSYGKTSTKEFIGTLLTSKWSVLVPPGSYNTPMGISRVIREKLEPRHDIFVAEMGDYVPGDIRFLCDLVQPSIGVITAIGPEHLERFKTMDNVAAAKQELADAVPESGFLVVNADDPAVRAIGERAARRGLRVVRYGLTSEKLDVRASQIRSSRAGLTFNVDAGDNGTATIQVPLLGRHNVSNILAATCVALELGMSLAEVTEACARIAPVKHRLELLRGDGGISVIDDTFNSNPRGAAEAISVLGDLDGGRRILVTPGMVELAEREAAENRELGRKAAAVCDEVVLVGPSRTRPIAAGLREAGFAESRIHVVANLAEASQQVQALARASDIVLYENDLPDTYDEGGSGVSAARNGVHETPAAVTTGLPMTTVRLEELDVAYHWAAVDGTRPIVVLHGWGASAAAVRSIVGAFGSERTVLAPDLPGFGASQRPEAVWGSEQYAQLICELLQYHAIREADVIGHSFGGKIGILLAANRPEVVRNLVLVNSAGIRPQRTFAYHARVASYKLAKSFIKDTARFGSADFQQAGAMRNILVRVVNEDVTPLLPSIRQRTLLVWGDQDSETPVSDGYTMERFIPNAGLVVFPGAGHFAYIDDAGRFARVVTAFLED